MIRTDGSVERITATRAEDGRWVATASLGAGDAAAIEAGDLVDANGEINGERIVVAG